MDFYNPKREQALRVLKEHPVLLTIVMDYASLNGPRGEKVGVITRTQETDDAIRGAKAKGIERLSTVVTDLLVPLGIDVMRPSGRGGSPSKTIFQKPAQLLALASEIGERPTGEFVELGNELVAARSGPTGSSRTRT